jgi:hypothetical protein
MTENVGTERRSQVVGAGREKLRCTTRSTAVGEVFLLADSTLAAVESDRVAPPSENVRARAVRSFGWFPAGRAYG